MDTLVGFFNINHIFFSILGYPMSYIEFIGTSLGLISVWLATKANIHTWSTGILNIIAFFAIYYQVQLYSDMLLQIYFFAMSIYGWIIWKEKKGNSAVFNVDNLSVKLRLIYLGGILISCALLGILISDIHVYLPGLFAKPAAFPYADALTTVLSIAATILMANKKIECWLLWIIVDAVSIYLYLMKGIVFVSVEYSVFLVLATLGFFDWIKYYRNAKRAGAGQIYATS